MNYLSYVLAAYLPIDEADTQAAAIIDDVPVNFIELRAMDGSIEEVSGVHDEMQAKHCAPVVVLHIGTVASLLDVMGAGHE